MLAWGGSGPSLDLRVWVTDEGSVVDMGPVGLQRGITARQAPHDVPGQPRPKRTSSHHCRGTQTKAWTWRGCASTHGDSRSVGTVHRQPHTTSHEYCAGTTPIAAGSSTPTPTTRPGAPSPTRKDIEFRTPRPRSDDEEEWQRQGSLAHPQPDGLGLFRFMLIQHDDHFTLW